MKRDMELVRKIAFQLEELPRDTSTSDLVIDGYSPESIGLHCQYMHDAGLFQGYDMEASGDPYPSFGFLRLTPAGHDFVDAARSDTVWNKVMKMAKEKGIGLTIELTVQALKATATSLLLGP